MFTKLLTTILATWYLLFAGVFTPKVPQSEAAPNPYAVMCHTDDMAQWADDATFRALHHEPIAGQFDLQGKNIKFKVKGGEKGNAYLLKAKKKSKKWLFVYQEWWGLNDHIRAEADKYYQALDGNVNVLAVDMYDGNVTTDRAQAATFMQGVKEPRLEALVRGAQQLAGKKAEIASVGWCFGGGWSLKSALLTGAQTKACIMYYGMPVRDAAKLKTLNCNVLGHFATEEYISKEVVEDFAAKMKEADKNLTYRIFNGVHGFANPSNPKFDKALADETFQLSVAFLKEKL
jgi:carboxymethylenebutenolidase